MSHVTATGTLYTGTLARPEEKNNQQQTEERSSPVRRISQTDVTSPPRRFVYVLARITRPAPFGGVEEEAFHAVLGLVHTPPTAAAPLRRRVAARAAAAAAVESTRWNARRTPPHFTVHSHLSVPEVYHGKWLLSARRVPHTRGRQLRPHAVGTPRAHTVRRGHPTAHTWPAHARAAPTMRRRRHARKYHPWRGHAGHPWGRLHRRPVHVAHLMSHVPTTTTWAPGTYRAPIVAHSRWWGLLRRWAVQLWRRLLRKRGAATAHGACRLGRKQL